MREGEGAHRTVATVSLGMHSKHAYQPGTLALAGVTAADVPEVPKTLNPEAQSPKPKVLDLNPNSQPQTLNPNFKTLNPKP